MLPYLLAMTVPVAVIALLVTRMQYRKHGKLTTIGVLLLCAMLIVPNFVLEWATRYEMPSTLVDYTGYKGIQYSTLMNAGVLDQTNKKIRATDGECLRPHKTDYG